MAVVGQRHVRVDLERGSKRISPLSGLAPNSRAIAGQRPVPARAATRARIVHHRRIVPAAASSIAPQSHAV